MEIVVHDTVKVHKRVTVSCHSPSIITVNYRVMVGASHCYLLFIGVNVVVVGLNRQNDCQYGG